eukprot:359544-Chlamydomonas_euryale.AAC.6
MEPPGTAGCSALGGETRWRRHAFLAAGRSCKLCEHIHHQPQARSFGKRRSPEAPNCRRQIFSRRPPDENCTRQANEVLHDRGRRDKPPAAAVDVPSARWQRLRAHLEPEVLKEHVRRHRSAVDAVRRRRRSQQRRDSLDARQQVAQHERLHARGAARLEQREEAHCKAVVQRALQAIERRRKARVVERAAERAKVVARSVAGTVAEAGVLHTGQRWLRRVADVSSRRCTRRCTQCLQAMHTVFTGDAHSVNRRCTQCKQAMHTV